MSGPDLVTERLFQLDSKRSLAARIGSVIGFGALITATFMMFAEPLWRDAVALFDGAPQYPQMAARSGKSASTSSLVAGPAVTLAEAQTAAPVGQPIPSPNSSMLPAAASVANDTFSEQHNQSAGLSLKSSSVRGMTEKELRFGMSAPFTGPSKELGQNMRLGIEAAFERANDDGGVHGRMLRLVAADDGYEPSRTTATMKQLYEKDEVFGIVGNVGTPTAVVAVPYSLERKMLFYGAFTGANLLRNDPPDRYVFNYRASYGEETEAIVRYLVKVKRLKPDQIAVFAQQDAYGDAGFAGVAKALRSLRGGNESNILRLNYPRNTVNVEHAVEELKKQRGRIKAVVMVPTYRAAAKFIEKTRDAYPDMIYVSISFVGSTALANELVLLGPRYANGVIVTQVVPAVEGHSSLVLDYKSALARHFPGEAPDYVSLEGYVTAKVLIAALKLNGPELNTESLINTLENLRNFDVGLGTPVNFGPSEHQAIHKVWGTQLDAAGHYHPIELD